MSPAPDSHPPAPEHCSLADLGQQVRIVWTTLLIEEAGIRRPTDLARTWKLDQTLCTRLYQALKEPDSSLVLRHLPAPASLRTILVRARKAQVDGLSVEMASQTIRALTEMIDRVGGSKANLDTVAARHITGVRQKVEHAAKQQIFRGMASMLGVHARTSVVQVYLFPGEEPGTCDELGVHGFHGLLRLRPELGVLLGVREALPDSGSDEDVVLAALHGTEFDKGGLTTALREFCTSPFPEIELRHEGGKLLYALEPSPDSLPGEIDLFFASFERGAARLHATPENPRVREAFVANTPSQNTVYDIFVHKDLWPNIEPELHMLRTGDPRVPDLAAHSFDRLDFVENMNALGSSPSALPLKEYERYGELVEHVHERMGWGLGDFRCYRTLIRYPICGIWYSIQIPLPEEPKS